VRRPPAPQLLALVAALGLIVVLSLNWFAFEPPLTPQPPPGSGIVNLLNMYAGQVHASGWAGLGALPVAWLALAGVGAVVGLRVPGVLVGLAAVAVLVVTLVTEERGIVLRWPAYLGVALTFALPVAAAWSSRGDRG
jgi:hypothetical protein